MHTEHTPLAFVMISLKIGTDFGFCVCVCVCVCVCERERERERERGQNTDCGFQEISAASIQGVVLVVDTSITKHRHCQPPGLCGLSHKLFFSSTGCCYSCV
jgi:hypothetical protein